MDTLLKKRLHNNHGGDFLEEEMLRKDGSGERMKKMMRSS
jgi:hypothetical protein